MTRPQEQIDTLVTLSDDELRKVRRASEKEIAAALEKGREQRASFEAASQAAPSNSRVRVR